jgi:hypothetical protein
MSLEKRVAPEDGGESEDTPELRALRRIHEAKSAARPGQLPTHSFLFVSAESPYVLVC